jgi:hypothetical protein
MHQDYFKGDKTMTEATMFHMLEPVLMDLYNAKSKTDSKEKQDKIQKWIDTLQGDPSLEEFEKIFNEYPNL